MASFLISIILSSHFPFIRYTLMKKFNRICFWVLFPTLCSVWGGCSSKVVPPPLPVLPLPTYSQLKWQMREIIMFHHFGVNTFTDREWGTGHENPAVFYPKSLDAGQWVDVAKRAGVSLVILTAKHHDGFCLWPSKYTKHSVRASPWKGGKGDVVGEFASAVRAGGIDLGLYLSPWDRHEKSYGKEIPYNEFYLGQLQELLRRYGSVQEVWFDGAKDPKAANMTYDFSSWFAMVNELQSSINIFSDAGPSVRWVGNEKGYAGDTTWSTINRTALHIGDASIVNYLNTGDEHGIDWLPPECDVSIRPGWFWHKSERPKPLSQLLHIYYNSVGRNCVMLLNVPPNTSGLISDIDVERLVEFRQAIDRIFTRNLAIHSRIKASSRRGGSRGDFGVGNVLDGDHLWTYWAPAEGKTGEHWIEFKWAKDNVPKFNVVRIQEAVGLGQRIKRHAVFVDEECVANGTTVGHKKLHRLNKAVHGRKVIIKIIDYKSVPLISSVGIHYDPYWVSKNGDGK